MLRALCLILLALGCHTAVAADADPAVDDTTLSAASDSDNADREESTASSDESTEDAAGATLVRDVNKPLAVNGNSMRGVAVMVAIRQLSPIMMALELESSVTDDWGGRGLGGLKKEVGCA